MIRELRDPKDPDSEEFFSWNFKPMLIDGDSIVSVHSVAYTENQDTGTVIGSPGIDAAGFVVSAKLGGCTKGKYYTVRCRVTTLLGETLDLSLRFYCDDT